MSIQPGSRFGRYRVVSELGRGGEAIVWLAEDERVPRQVALKIFPLAVAAGDSPALERFRKEADALARLDHPGICRIHDAGIEDGCPFIAMSYVEGTTLDALPAPGEKRAIAIAENVARIMEAAHAAGVVHGDLKPQNILVARSGACVVLDFGVSGLLDESWRGGPGGVAGTLPYLAPERLSRAPDSASDVYALGAVLFELVTGRPPFVEETRAALVKKLLLEDAPLCRSIDREASRDLEAVLAKALHREPSLRYPTMAAFADDLGRLARGEPPAAARFGPVRKALRFARRRPAAAALIAFVVVFLVTAVAIALVKNRALERYLERTGFEAGRSVAAARAAEEHLVRYTRLADLRRLADLDLRARRLVPPAPDLVPALRSWMTAAESLAGGLDRHRAALESLRSRGVRKAESRPGGSGPTRREIAGLQQRRDRLAAIADGAAATESRRKAAKAVQELDERIRKLDSSLPRIDAWEYGGAAEAWQDATLSALIDALEKFAGSDPVSGTMSDVRRRIREAELLATGSDAGRRAWDDAIAAIGDRRRSPAYDGLVLARQVGLVPLGQNADTGLWEFHHVLSGAMPGAASRPVMERATGVVLVLIPGGLARSGARRPGPGDPAEGPHLDPNAFTREFPVDEVLLDPFFMSKFEMTESQWARAVGAEVRGASDSEPKTRPLPVVSVDWHEATRVLARIGLSLPTEAQWEYAARAGTTTPWWTGTTPATLKGAEVYSRPERFPVGTLRPNPFGLFDVAGNVAEWCADRFVTYETPKLPRTGERFAFNVPDLRSYRGGAYPKEWSHRLRSAYRDADPPGVRRLAVGIRPARALDR